MAGVEEYSVATEGDSPDRSLYLRRRQADEGGTPILMMHGSTLPGSFAFDLKLGNRSWMEDLTAAGHDVWSLDLRGYGKSWKPDPERLAGGDERPLVGTEEAIEDLTTAVGFILEKTGSPAIDLIGWSWGSTIVGAATSRKRLPVRRLVLHAPQWLRSSPSLMVTPEALRSSYRSINPRGMKDRWFRTLPDGVRRAIERLGWDAVFQAELQAQEDLTVPNGTVKDIADFWDAGRPFYEPCAIDVPTAIIVGDADGDTPPEQAKAIFARIPEGLAELIILPEGTHFAVFEPVREQLFSATRRFLARP